MGEDKDYSSIGEGIAASICLLCGIFPLILYLVALYIRNSSDEEEHREVLGAKSINAFFISLIIEIVIIVSAYFLLVNDLTRH
jgi:hypothetical protein